MLLSHHVRKSGDAPHQEVLVSPSFVFFASVHLRELVDVDLFQRFVGLPPEFLALCVGHPAEVLLESVRDRFEAVPEDFGL